MSSKPMLTAEGDQTITSTRLRRIRPAPCMESKHNNERTKHKRGRKKEAEKRTAADLVRRQKRRESDARCRANLSSGFDFLRSQILRNQEVHMKMSKEALLYSSIDQIRYLEAILVLLQQAKDKSSKKATSQPADILQEIHKKFVREKDGILEDRLTLQGNLSATPNISKGAGKSANTFVPQSSKSSVKRQTLKGFPTVVDASKEDPSLLHSSQRRKSVHKPNILVKKSSDKPGSCPEKGKPLTPKASQEVPKTPQRHGGSSGMESDIHQVPGTPVNVESLDENLEMSASVKHYRIRGQQIKSMTPKGLKMCNNCQIQDSEGSIDLTCHEDPEDWKDGVFEGHLHTPNQGKSTNQDAYVTPKVRKKTLSTPKNGPRSRKCLFKSTAPTPESESKVDPPQRRYYKRATAARTRPWDSKAMKVISPFQPYSGLYQERKKMQASKDAARAKPTPDNFQLIMTKPTPDDLLRIKTIQIMNRGVVSASADQQPQSVRVSSSTKNTFATRHKSNDIPKKTRLGDGDEDCKSSSQDSLSMQEIPRLPEDIQNFISRGGVPLFSDPEDPLDLSLTSSRQLCNVLGDVLGDDNYPPLDMSGTTVLYDGFSGGDSLLGHQDRLNIDPLSQEYPQYNCSSDYAYVDHTIYSPSHSRMFSPNVFNERYYPEISSHSVEMLDRLEPRNVWQGGLNNDITLAQLQRQPIIGNQDSVYESPQWSRTPFSPHLHPCTENEWVDVESSEEVSNTLQDSWDTADFLSSIDSNSKIEDASGSSQQSSSSSFANPYGYQGDCSAVRDIEEYQVVPFYHPEE